MYLQHVRVQNFRNLRNVEVCLQPGLNVLVGRNSTGKSNLFLALRHALGAGAARGDNLPWLEREDVWHDGVAHCGDPIRVILTFAALDRDRKAQFFEMLDVGDDGDLSVARLRYEAQWDEKKKRFRIDRWGGADGGERSPIPNALIEALPVTFLPALRDAEAALSPGSRSRLARLIEDHARDHSGIAHEEEIRGIFDRAHVELHQHDLIQKVSGRVQAVTEGMAGTDYTAPAIRATPANFGRILRALRIVLDGMPISELSLNSLGYNNLLYIATVLAHLRESPADEVPLLLIEEPEAHLHPQLTIRLGEYLSGELIEKRPPQTVVTTHSAALASKVKPSQVAVLHTMPGSGLLRCNSLHSLQLSATEERQLQRMLDITRATLYFAKGLILVEGVCEALLVPELARRLGYNLTRSQVSVVPLCGVAFSAFAKILHPGALGIPAAIVSDADPPIEQKDSWKTAVPRRVHNGFAQSDRMKRLLSEFEGHPTVRVCPSDVTLEYDLAAAGPDNPTVMTLVWEQLVPGSRVLNQAMLSAIPPKDHALAVWRGVCRADHSGSKADFAHLLAEWLSNDRQHPTGMSFAVPDYIRMAIEHACPHPLRLDEPEVLATA
jgi:putative ATP-dependent endonuclease of OLD family